MRYRPEMEFETVYDVIAKICGLKPEADAPSIYYDAEGKKYFLDKYGFHTATQYAMFKIEEQKKILDAAIHKYNVAINDDTISIRTKRKLKRILDADRSCDDKINIIREGLK